MFLMSLDGYMVFREKYWKLKLVFNYSMMPEFTESSRTVVSDALEDFRITGQERSDVVQALTGVDYPMPNHWLMLWKTDTFRLES